MEPEWVESCYGINCDGYTAEPIKTRSDWGYNAEHCTKQYHIIYTDKNNTVTEEFDYLTGICKL